MYPMNISQQTWKGVLSSFLGRVGKGLQEPLHVLSSISGYVSQKENVRTP